MICKLWCTERGQTVAAKRVQEAVLEQQEADSKSVSLSRLLVSVD